MEQANGMIEAPAHMPAVCADGKRNAYYLDCKPLEQKKPYAACLHTIKLSQEGALPSMYSACDVEIRAGRCKALGMREQEELQGRAIYFTERTSVGIVSGAAESMRRFFDGLKNMAKGFTTSPEPTPRPAPTPKKKDFLDRIDAPDYAMAITDMVAEETTSTVPAMPKLDIRPGETPLEAARRMKAQQTQPKE